MNCSAKYQALLTRPTDGLLVWNNCGIPNVGGSYECRESRSLFKSNFIIIKTISDEHSIHRFLSIKPSNLKRKDKKEVTF